MILILQRCKCEYSPRNFEQPSSPGAGGIVPGAAATGTNLKFRATQTQFQFNNDDYVNVGQEALTTHIPSQSTAKHQDGKVRFEIPDEDAGEQMQHRQLARGAKTSAFDQNRQNLQ